LPPQIRQCFQDVADRLQENLPRITYSNREHAATITAEFTGIIPPDAKKQIEAVKPKVIRQIVFVNDNLGHKMVLAYLDELIDYERPEEDSKPKLKLVHSQAEGCAA
jgi:hypothetical protein